MESLMAAQQHHESKLKLIEASTNVIRAKGYAATTVDDICHKAGVTKGSFFHHFKSKDELAVAAATYFGTMSVALFATAPYASSATRWIACSAIWTFAGSFFRAN